ncbi:MAG: hypothetical protein N4A54_12180 [Peptostreptococcaceae bacterium]|jgi:hypothetical protein|nr:hypothetical protein [Peptostreptococcaceae bacterium]
MLKNVVSKLLVLVLIIGVFSGCTKSSEKNEINEESKLPKEIEPLVAIAFGNQDSDTVVIYSQGGPDTEIEEGILEEIRDSNDELKDALFIHPYQVQTKNPKKFIDKEINFEDAIEYDKETVKDLYDICKFYKNQNKKVYVVGISFGAFVTTDLINTYGTDMADGFGIMVGRLNIEDEFWKAFSQGKGGGYEEGTKPVITEAEGLKDSNMYKLAAGIGHKRFMEELKDVDLSKVVYVYGKLDEQVGSLTNEEIKFLKDHKARVIANEKGHSEASTDETASMMKMLLSK